MAVWAIDDDTDDMTELERDQNPLCFEILTLINHLIRLGELCRGCVECGVTRELDYSQVRVRNLECEAGCEVGRRKWGPRPEDDKNNVSACDTEFTIIQPLRR